MEKNNQKDAEFYIIIGKDEIPIRSFESNEIENTDYQIYPNIFILNEKLMKINEILTYLDNLNEKIKLLGFNSALESYKLGISGKRLFDNAKEIKNMTEFINNSLRELIPIVDDMQKKSSSLLNNFSCEFKESIHNVLNSENLQRVISK